MATQFEWRRAIGEGAFVLAGILLAFWIDAWWDDFQRAGLETELLVSLTSDLVRNHEQLSNIIHARELGMEALHEFLGMSPSEIAELAPGEATRTLLGKAPLAIT